MGGDDTATSDGGDPTERTVVTGPEPADAGASSSLSLASSADSASLLERLSLPLAEVIKVRLRKSGDGGRIGRYLVLRLLGEGGMGAVFSAYDDELDRKVAIKLLRSDGPAGSRLDRAWLLAEAKAMAKISHPNVVQIYDVGEVADPGGDPAKGQIFVAMELIRGTTLGAWLREKRRGWREIVDLFIQAGQGLEAVHAAGLVHRDFKPQNVLVGEDGRVRVLDFGLAYRPIGEAAMVSASASLSEGTLSQTHAGTPAYMAPEQHDEREVDARADQFAFGVALHEALYGERPFAGRHAREIAAAIRADERRAPPSDARVPAHLRRIVDRALRPLPVDRYPSMTSLLADLRADPWRTWRRVGALVGVALAILTLTYVIDGQRAAAAAREALACAGGEARIAEVDDPARRDRVAAAFRASGLVYAEDTWSKVQERFDTYEDAWASVHRRTCEAHRHDELSGNLYDRASACLDAARRDLGALVDVFTEADAAVVERAIKASELLPPVARCEDRDALLARVAPPEDPTTASAVEGVRGSLARISAELETSHTERCAEIDGLSERAKELAYGPLVAEVAAHRSRCAEVKGDYEAAVRAMQEAIYAALAAGDERLAANGYQRLAHILGTKLGRFAEAEPWIRHAEALVVRLDDDELLAKVLLAKGATDLVAGRLDEALAAFEASRDLFRRRYGDRHSGVAMASNNIAVAHARLGHFDDIAVSFKAALDASRELLGPDHPDTLMIAGNLGAAYFQARDFEHAQPILEETLARKEALVGPEHPEVAVILLSLGALHQLRAELSGDRGELDQARDLLERALAIRERALGPDNTRTAYVLTAIGETYNERGEHAKARDLLARGDAIYVANGELETPNRAFILARLGRAISDGGDPRAALSVLEHALAIHRASPSQPEEGAYTRFQLARALARASQRPADRRRARELAEEARALYAENARVFDVEVKRVDAWLADER
ncbi:MAG: serine/threonine protein kinase [Myxococcales bacterium]|nr:serine/threonine protein kinase [Myxococcales bacterium]